MKEKKEYIEPELYVIEMEKSIFLAASPVTWDIDRKDVPGQNTNEDDADVEVGTLSTFLLTVIWFSLVCVPESSGAA